MNSGLVSTAFVRGRGRSTEIISAVTSENHDVPMPMLSPATIEGSAPGEDHLAEHRQRASAQADRRRDQAPIQHLHAVHRIEQDREERADERDEHHAVFTRSEQ